MKNQFIVQLGQYRFDVAHSQGTSVVDVLGDFVGVDSCTVGYSGVVGYFAFMVGRCWRRVNVKFNSHNSKLFLYFNLGQEVSLLW
jgi:hypothetical protein